MDPVDYEQKFLVNGTLLISFLIAYIERTEKGNFEKKNNKKRELI